MIRAKWTIPGCGIFMILAGFSLGAQERQFPPDAVVNITLAPYHAKPDDGKDDTAAIQQAITDNVETGRFLYFPAGVYEISAPLAAKNPEGQWRAQLTLQGQGRNRTILKLRDQAEDFGDPAHPQAVISTGSHWQTGDALEGGGNKAFRNNIMDLTLDTGSNNPGAIGIEWAVSNHGTLKNLLIRSGDGKGVAGISMQRKIPGPGLIKQVEISGFDSGLDIGDIQYGVTVEDLTLRDQRKTGIHVGQNLLHGRKIRSFNRVPAITVSRIEGVVTLLDSEFSGGAPDQPAIKADGPLTLRNVVTTGYQANALIWKGKPVAQTTFKNWNGTAEAAPPLLPVEETPDFWNADLTDWQPVGPRQPGEDNDAPAIQRAVDAGKSTVYFPPGRVYFLSDTVIVRGQVRQLHGMGSEISLGAAKQAFGNRENPRPLFRIDPTDADTVFFDHIFFNAQYPGEVLFENNTPADVVIRHCGGWVGLDGMRRSYQNTPRATGRLFVEDVFLPGWDFNRQQVWARQFNPENYDSDGSTSQVTNQGGRLWILGFKTEGAAPFITTTDGGVTELLGGYNYISAAQPDPVPQQAVPYIVENAEASLTFTSENFRDTDYPVYIRNIQGEKVNDVPGNQLPPRNGRPGDRSFSPRLFHVFSTP